MPKQDIKIAKSRSGKSFEFVLTSNPPAGAMKYVYFSPKKDYVIGFFKDKQDARAIARLESITDRYRHDIFEQIGGDYWKNLYCWPEEIVEWDGKIGIVVPSYAQNFFFQFDKNRKGKEKQGKWFASAKLLRLMDKDEKGNFLTYLQISVKIAQAVRRMHTAGLAHSDLSYKNVLIDPHGGNACIIDIDGLVVPQKYPPDVLGTPDFIAPEVLCDKTRKTLPSQKTDRHALAVLIYMYLLHRHPLRGGRFFGPDVEAEDEELLLMGKDPLYIEHPTDNRNRNMKREYGDDLSKFQPWVDLKNFSAAKIAGPFLAALFERAFINGLQNPMSRPAAEEWENALYKTCDRLLPCSNPSCSGKWYVFDNSKHPRCPFCGTEYKGLVPKLEFYSCRAGSKTYKPDNHQLMVFNGQSLSRWHVMNNVFPNEKITAEDRERQAYFLFHNGTWRLVNERLTSLFEVLPDGSKVQKKAREFIELKEGTKILLSTEAGGRLAIVQLAGK